MTYKTIDALLELNLEEGFATSDEHYAYDPKNKVNVDARGREYHGHVAPNVAVLQAALQQGALVYPGLTKDEYVKAAMDLAVEDCADANLTTTRSGVVGFAGTKNTEWNGDYTYKIRLKSAILNKDYLEQKFGKLAGMILQQYKAVFGTEDFCDVVIVANDEKKLTSDPTVVTFYCTTLAKAQNLMRRCNVYDDERATASTNVKQQMLVIADPNQKNRIVFRVVKPTSISSSNKQRKTGVDNYTQYNSGAYIDNKGNIHEFKVADNINKQLKNKEGDEYAASSRVTGVAKDTFKLAAAKEIFNNEKTIVDNFRQRYVNNLISVWVTTPQEAGDFINNEPRIKALIEYVYNISEEDDYNRYQDIMRELSGDIYKQWRKLEVE